MTMRDEGRSPRPPRRFSLDSNILVYAADAADPPRQEAAIEIIARAARRDCILTVQALAEFFHAVTRKGIVPRPAAATQVRSWEAVFPVSSGAGSAALLTAIEAASLGRFQFFDALLLATARECGCAVLISEDMADGAELDGVRVVAAFDRHRQISTAALALL